jgi:hypothetical protein
MPEVILAELEILGRGRLELPHMHSAILEYECTFNNRSNKSHKRTLGQTRTRRELVGFHRAAEFRAQSCPARSKKADRRRQLGPRREARCREA